MKSTPLSNLETKIENCSKITCMSDFINQISLLYGVVVRIFGCYAEGTGSIPGTRSFFDIHTCPHPLSLSPSVEVALTCILMAAGDLNSKSCYQLHIHSSFQFCRMQFCSQFHKLATWQPKFAAYKCTLVFWSLSAESLMVKSIFTFTIDRF